MATGVTSTSSADFPHESELDWLNEMTAVVALQDCSVREGSRYEVTLNGERVTVEIVKVDGNKAVLERVGSGFVY